MRSTDFLSPGKISRALILFLPILLAPSARGKIKIVSDFPGGSGVATETVENGQPVLRLDPTDHPGKGWRCWWYVKLRGLTPGQPFLLDVGEAPWATPDQAAWSLDGGQTWRHTDKGVREGKRIRYTLTPPAAAIDVAWGPPFVPADAAALVENLAAKLPGAVSFTLCQTREGRPTPALRIRPPGDTGPRPLVWLQARQHAWESGASWVAKGLGEWLVSDEAGAVALRKDAEIVLAPIMDIDNVHRGAGGKNQEPQDHNRDWSDAPHWNAVAAAQKEIRQAADEDRLAVFIDLHNPSAGDRAPYFYVPPAEAQSGKARENQAAFVALAKAEISGPLAFEGRVTESGPKYDPKNWSRISKNWVATLGTPAIAVTLETAWNTPASTTEGYQEVGRQLGRTISRYLSGEKNDEK